MSNLAKLEFVALDISGKNYLSWINDAEVHLEAMNLGETIKEANEASSVDQAKAMIFLRRHIHEGLKCEYLTIKDPLALWGNLKISSKLRLCGENITDADLLEKTFTTFHASNVNHQSRPTRSAPFHEVNAALASSHEAYATSSHGDRRRGRGRGRGTRNGQVQNSNSHRLGPRNTQASHNHQKVIEEACHRCGTNGHWARVCRTPKYLVDLYQASIKGKGKKVETYWMDADPTELEPVDATHLDVSDFFVDTDGKSFDPMISDGILPN
ncbi:uncharacterized protein LOC110756304 [Prunus avium]|uniref:Uncharacterized protein LOC110756304 n=1 Tax=Prunus avium TaxID=42229 RepID=A0A6P5SBZ3_PRUAV|nr:uncharacterized protein LOC110756304 [Prunus avium]